MKGMLNLGNTCYFSSALQCLLQIPPLSNYFIRNEYTGDCEFTKEYRKVVLLAWKNKDVSVIDPTRLLRLFWTRFSQFANRYPHDAQEAFICIIDILEPFTKPLINFNMIQETVCPSGKTMTDVVSTILTLNPGKTLEDSLKSTLDWSTIENYEDTSGKVWNVAATRTSFSTFPKVLVLSMNCKMDITVPESIFDGEYNLIASCIHFGTVNGGHYVSLTKHKGVWYLKDDNVVTKQNSFIPHGGHYLLVYHKQ